MLRSRRARLPVLAEISPPPPEARAWSLRRGDYTSLGGLLPQLAERRVVLVAGEGEVPVVVAIALAAAAAAANRRTIVVDCDLARPRLAAHLGITPAPGLHEYLRWEAEPADVLQPVMLAGPAAAGSIEPLVCVCGGRPATKAETLLGLQSFAHMVAKLRTAYELVLLIGPGVLSEAVAATAVAAQADASVAGLLAREAEGKTGRELRAAIRRLPAPPLGSIVIATS
jgi:succinoglycan biosynthesis transport protein ExoP